MTYAEFIQVVLGNIPVNTGNMIRNAPHFFDTAHEYLCIYSGVHYLGFQEEGTKFFNGNKGFISKNTVGQLNALSMSGTLGLNYDMQQTERNILQHQDKMLVELGVIQYV